MTDGAHSASLVVPCLNRADGLKRLLVALARQTIRDRLEIIVVDNGSRDGSRDVAARFADVVLEARGGRGSSAARNLGLANARHPFLLTTDSDCVPSRDDWAAVHLAALQAADDDVVAGAGALQPLPCDDWWAMRSDITPQPAFTSDGAPAYAVGGSACYRTQLLRDIGGYPDCAADDAAVGKMAAARGLRTIWVPEAVVFHENAPGARAYLAQRRKIGAYAAEINGPPPSSARYSLEVARHVATGLKPLAQFDFAEAFARTAGALAGHAGAISVLAREGAGRRRVLAPIRGSTASAANMSAECRSTQASSSPPGIGEIDFG